MQFLRAAGAIVVALCGLEGARRLNRSADEDISGLGAYLSLLRYVRSQIDLYALPLSEIFARVSRDTLFACGWREAGAPQSFDELLTCVRINDAEARAVIFEFSSEFGRSYREEELRRCDFALGALEKCRERLLCEVAKKKKLNLTLGICASLAIIILLI